MSNIPAHHVKPQILELYRRIIHGELHPEDAQEQRKGNRVRYTFTFEERQDGSIDRQHVNVGLRIFVAGRTRLRWLAVLAWRQALVSLRHLRSCGNGWRNRAAVRLGSRVRL